MLASADQILVAKGRKIKTWYPQQDAKADILKDVMGRSGNLRAPSLQIGNIFLIGFNEELYRQQFKTAE